MTLRRLQAHLGIDAPAEAPAKANVALTFVLNEDFLPGLRVLCYSLCRHRTLLDLPVLIISESAALFDDPLVAMAADTTRLATPEEIKGFGNISSEMVEQRLKLDWIPKYTYLKWLMFDEYGYDRHIFIDADIVCLRPIDELLELTGADLFGGPVFPRSLIAAKDVPLTPAQIDERIAAFSLNPKPSGRRLNTGVLAVGKRMLSKRFRDNLIAFTETGAYSVEQAALRTYVSSTKGMRLRLISPVYNFKYGYLDQVSSETRAMLLERVKLLHFAGADRKPWAKTTPKAAGELIWRRYADEAAAFPILRG